MSGIEVDAKTILLRLIKDQAGALNIEEQRAVARWLALKAVLAKYAKPLLDQDKGWATQFYAERRPPRTWQIRLGRAVLNAGNPIFFATTPYDAYFHSGLADREIAVGGFSFVIAVGSFAGQVLGSRQDAAIPLNRNYFTQIWPHPLLRQGFSPPDLSAVWPPEANLNEEFLYQCAQKPDVPSQSHSPAQSLSVRRLTS
jgi:hypothetical protein